MYQKTMNAVSWCPPTVELVPIPVKVMDVVITPTSNKHIAILCKVNAEWVVNTGYCSFQSEGGVRRDDCNGHWHVFDCLSIDADVQ